MKLKALKNIDGVVKAHAGQEFEVQNQQLAKDLIQQGVAYSTDTQGSEVDTLLKQDAETLEAQAEIDAIERKEYERAYSDTIQEEVNKADDEKHTKIEEVKQRAKEKARQAAQQAKQTKQAKQGNVGTEPPISQEIEKQQTQKNVSKNQNH